MKKIGLIQWFSVRLISVLCTLGLSVHVFAQVPLDVPAGLFDLSDKQTLGLKPAKQVEHYTVFKAIEGKAQYNHGAVLFAFKNKLFAQWQSSVKDEDGPNTHVLYSQSDDGQHWNQTRLLAPERAHSIVTSGGWWSDGSTLVAFVNVWPKNLNPKSGHVEYALSKDGKNWSNFKPVTDIHGEPVKGIIEQDLKAVDSGRVITAIHIQPGLKATPYYTDDPLAISGWQAGEFQNLPHQGDISRELEPSWYKKPNGDLVMTFRDQGGSYKILAAVSKDNAISWTQAEVTHFPDSRAKQSAGNFPNGMAYIVNNPTGNKTRLPLVVSISRNGSDFNQAYILRGQDTLPAMLYQGKYKRIGYSYPKSIVWKNQLWVAYGVNKEDIAVTRLNLAQFK